MAIKVLWVSRHRPHASQLEALRERYGRDVMVDLEPRPFDDARFIAQRFREGGYSDMVIAAPLSVIQVLCNEQIPMLWSEAVPENNTKLVEFRGARGQGYRFVRFRRIKRVVMEFAD